MTGGGSNNTSSSHSKNATSVSLSPDMDGNVSDNQQQKKGPWQFLKRQQAQSNEESAPPLPVDSEFGGLDSRSQPGRSFVVIRKNQSAPRAPDPSSSREPSGSKAGTATF